MIENGPLFAKGIPEQRNWWSQLGLLNATPIAHTTNSHPPSSNGEWPMLHSLHFGGQHVHVCAPAATVGCWLNGLSRSLVVLIQRGITYKTKIKRCQNVSQCQIEKICSSLLKNFKGNRFLPPCLPCCHEDLNVQAVLCTSRACRYSPVDSQYYA